MTRMGTAVLALTAALLPAGSGTAWAQSNEISIRQDGTGNNLLVDQSNASESAVGGLTLDAAGSADGRPIEILGFQPTDVARQIGSGNAATVVLSGTGGRANLVQDNSSAGGGRGNTATVNVGGNAVATVGQFGSGNDATVKITGDLGEGTILQNGDGNRAIVAVNGDGSGTLIQNGDRNSRGLDVVGGSNVTYVQNGSGLSDATSNAAIASAIAGGATGLPAGVQVISNAASVQITQTALPGIGR